MKTKLTIVAGGLVLCSCVLLSQPILDFPSQRLSQPVKFLLVSTDDMRLFISAYATLNHRIARGVCLIDCIYPTNLHGAPVIFEVPVAAGMPLQDALKKVGGHLGGRQVRVFQQNRIEQAPILKRWDDPEAVKFRELVLSPGDVVVLTITGE